MKSLGGHTLLIDGRSPTAAVCTPRGDGGIEFESDVSPPTDGVDAAKPAADAYPSRWNGLIGEYGWDHNMLYILEREGKLHALIEWFYLYPLDEVRTPGRFAFPRSGLYHGEKLLFIRRARPDAPATAADLEAPRCVSRAARSA